MAGVLRSIASLAGSVLPHHPASGHRRSWQKLDAGRDHSIWLPDHMVSFWPDSIWTP